MRTLVLLACTFLATHVAYAQKPVTIVVEQTDAPLTIRAYDASYSEGGRYSTKGIRHEVTYSNTSGRKIVASQIGLVSFSIFNKFLDRTGGIDMDDIEPNATADGTWVASSYADFSFHTGIAYVARVRFEDGEVWEADLDEVTRALRKIESDFDVAKLDDSPDASN